MSFDLFFFHHLQNGFSTLHVVSSIFFLSSLSLSHFTFVDFFPIEEMANQNLGFNVISMQEYLETQGR